MKEKNLEEIKKEKENKETKIFNINELKIIKNKRKCNNVSLKKEKNSRKKKIRKKCQFCRGSLRRRYDSLRIVTTSAH